MRQDSKSSTAMFEIQTLERLSDQRPDLLGAPRKSGTFEIIWIKSGSGVYSIDLENQEFSGQVVCCADIGQLHTLRTNDNVKGYRISFSSQFLHPLEITDCFLFGFRKYMYSGKASFIKPDGELQGDMEEIIAKMQKEAATLSLLGSEILKELVKILLIHLTRKFGENKTSMSIGKRNELVQRFMTLLEDNVTRKKMVSDYASELSVTPNYLNEVIKRVTGFSAHYHISQRTVLEAKRQAIHYRSSMKEIAYNLGYEDLAHFSRFFKINAGLNFQDFKKEIQERVHW